MTLPDPRWNAARHEEDLHELRTRARTRAEAEAPRLARMKSERDRALRVAALSDKIECVIVQLWHVGGRYSSRYSGCTQREARALAELTEQRPK